jgi:transcription elongation factor GreA
VTDTATPAASYLTQEAYDRLKGELTQLTGEGRTEISKKIEAARDEGDLKENGGYHAAKEEQGTPPRTTASSSPAWLSRWSCSATS